MPSDPKSTALVGRTLDRAALDRVLARAAEIQLAGAVGETSESISEADIIEIGKEVGLSPGVLRQALAEERTRIALMEEGGLVAKVAGPRTAYGSRTVTGNPSEILAALDTWMIGKECLQVQRRFGERVVWEPARGLWSGIKKSVNVQGRGFDLCRASCVAATVSEVATGRTHVRMDADLTPSRTARVRGASALVGMGVVAAGGAAVLGVAITAAPIFIAAGALVPLLGFGSAAYA
ncbi:MAG TPA: hypothetical protein VMY38_04980, partial [Gemmatimonadaceae bacterium]|nr:hypothetical protein [Gemmatimonadaceae bacterium]